MYCHLVGMESKSNSVLINDVFEDFLAHDDDDYYYDDDDDDNEYDHDQKD